MHLKDFSDFNFVKKAVIIRVDFNVPVKDNIILDSFRIDQSLSTINKLLKNQCKIIIISHMGNPKGIYDKNLSLKVVGEYLEKKIERKVNFINDCMSKDIKEKIQFAKYGDIILLENLRFYPQEEQNNKEFAEILASYGDCYINDAFSCSHRKHASINKLSYIHNYSFAGYLFMQEISMIDKYVKNPKKPVAAILGGSKISTKIKLIKSLLDKVNILFIAGAMANNFLKADAIDIGKSFYEEGFEEEIKEIKRLAKEKNIQIILPIDFAVATNINQTNIEYLNVGDLIGERSIFDVGIKTIEFFNIHLKNMSSVIWNGPIGAFEYEPFNQGTMQLAKAIANESEKNNLISIAGGGDTVSAINQVNLKEKFTFISTAGGAFLSYIENNQLKGLLKN